MATAVTVFPLETRRGPTPSILTLSESATTTAT